MDPPSYALRGLRESLHRLEVAHERGDNELVLIALGEHLHCQYAIGEWWKKQIGKKPYQALRAERDDGRSSGGLEWARGFATHELIEPGRKRALFPGDDVYPGGHLYLGTFWRWRSLLAHKDDPSYGRDVMYKERVAHRGLFIPIDEGAQSLTEFVPAYRPPS